MIWGGNSGRRELIPSSCARTSLTVRRWETFLKRANDGGCGDEYQPERSGHSRYQTADRHSQRLGMALDHAGRAGGADGCAFLMVALEQETVASSLCAAHPCAYPGQTS